MKKFTAVVFAAALIVGIGTPAYAEPAGLNSEELQAERLWHFAALPAWFPVWITIHEGSHWLAATSLGYHDCLIKPYPHYVGSELSLGETYCSRNVRPESNSLFFAAPFISDTAIFAGSDLLISAINGDSMAAGILFTGGMVSPWIDFVANANSPSVTSDNALLAKELGVPRWTVVLAADAMAIVGLWRLYARFREIFFDEPEEESIPIVIGIGADTALLQLTGIF